MNYVSGMKSQGYWIAVDKKNESQHFEALLICRIILMNILPRNYDIFHSSRIVILLLLHDGCDFVQKSYETFDPFLWLLFHNDR